jgi:membrane-associated phospholipid phosphatase
MAIIEILSPTARLRRAAIVAGMLVAAATPVAAQPRTEPALVVAGWRTWILSSGSQFRLPPPPDAAASRAELEQLRATMASRDAAAEARIAWWDSAAPAYRWNQIALQAAVAEGLNNNVASRRLALLHAALADAMVAAWDSKQAHGRLRPATVDPALRAVVATPATPSYPDEHAVAGAVAAAMLGAMFPRRAAEFAQLAEEAGRSRLLAGVSFPSDVAAGAALGGQIAAAALERGARDGSDRPWTGSVPTTPGSWNGANPIMPQAATWQPWLMAAPNEFRPAPPPAFDSPERAAEMAALRAFKRTPQTNATAMFWEVAVGGLRAFEYWNQHAARLLMEYGEGQDAPRAARAFALLNVAFYDAGVACWDAKFAYWTIRPFQLDPSFRTSFPTPNHPSYPAAHSCYSMTSALVLSTLFPRDAAALTTLGRVSGDSRVWAGIHYASDVAAGQQIAQRIAARAAGRRAKGIQGGWISSGTSTSVAPARLQGRRRIPSGWSAG